MRNLFFALLLLSFATSLFGSVSFRDGFMKITIKPKGLVENLNTTVLTTSLSNVIVKKVGLKNMQKYYIITNENKYEISKNDYDLILTYLRLY